MRRICAWAGRLGVRANIRPSDALFSQQRSRPPWSLSAWSRGGIAAKADIALSVLKN